jgi:hypothetical protein
LDFFATAGGRRYEVGSEIPERKPSPFTHTSPLLSGSASRGCWTSLIALNAP